MAGDCVAFAILGIEVIAAGLIMAYTMRLGTSPMPTLAAARREILAQVPPEASGTIAELGCGWGSLAVPLARRHPQCRVVGFELSPVPWAVSAARRRLAGLPNLEIRRADFFDASLEGASIVICYLFPGAMERLRAKFERELPPGALVISNTFAVPGWAPERTQHVGGLCPGPVYVYRRP